MTAKAAAQLAAKAERELSLQQQKPAHSLGELRVVIQVDKENKGTQDNLSPSPVTPSATRSFEASF